MSIPSITTRAELLGTAALFILFSSLFGATVSSLIYLVIKSAFFVLWALNILAGAF